METINRIAENGEQETKEPMSMDEAARRAQAVLESHRQSRLLTIQKELDDLLKRHNAGLEVRQMIVNGQPQATQIAIVLNPEQR
jgi:hypothetical protein